MKHSAVSFLLLITVVLFSLKLSGQAIPFSYISPDDGSSFINPEQTIALKTGEPFGADISEDLIKIVGSISAEVDFKCLLPGDRSTLILKPCRPFQLGEEVHVTIQAGMRTLAGRTVLPVSFHFQIKERQALDIPVTCESDPTESTYREVSSEEVEALRQARVLENNLPADFPPPVGVQFQSTNDDYIFLTPNARTTTSYENYLIICDHYGTPVFFRKMNDAYNNLTLLSGGMLAYARNRQPNSALEKYFIMDNDCQVIDSIAAGNGYNLDSHDILQLENGHFLILIYDPQPVDMSLIVPGGNPNATVTGLVIQEVDYEQNVFFQWRSWDHFSITDATSDISLTALFIDYVHGNALEMDPEGNILLSSRHLDEITKISMATGNILWRFGKLSENNQFTIQNDPDGFTHQHDVRLLPNGNITVFDNGNLRTPNFSQAVEYHLDEENMIATRIWRYRHSPDIYSMAAGGYMRQADGSNLVGWGAAFPITATEARQDGSVNFDLYLPDAVTSYRAERYAWETSLFSAPTVRNFGNIAGYADGKEKYVPVTNNSAQALTITSTYMMSDNFDIMSLLPVTIGPGETINLIVRFFAEEEGEYSDILTLNCDTYTWTTSQRIARQVKLLGINDDEIPSVFFDPAYGEVNADLNSPVIVNFSEPVRKAFGTEITNPDIPGLFTFKEEMSGDPVPFSGTVSDDKMTIMLFADNPLAEMTVYKVILIQNKVEDFQGNVITYPEITLFTTGIATQADERGEKGDLRVYPSPFADHLIINDLSKEGSEMTILNPSGKIIFHTFLTSSFTRLNTESWSEGMHIIRLEHRDGSFSVRKVIKGN